MFKSSPSSSSSISDSAIKKRKIFDITANFKWESTVLVTPTLERFSFLKKIRSRLISPPPSKSKLHDEPILHGTATLTQSYEQNFGFVSTKVFLLSLSLNEGLLSKKVIVVYLILRSAVSLSTVPLMRISSTFTCYALYVGEYARILNDPRLILILLLLPTMHYVCKFSFLFNDPRQFRLARRFDRFAAFSMTQSLT